MSWTLLTRYSGRSFAVHRFVCLPALTVCHSQLTAINKRKLEEASAPICFLYRLLSNPVLCKALDERMSDTHQIPAKRFSGTIEQQNLDAHAHTVIRAHLHKREKLRAYVC